RRQQDWIGRPKGCVEKRKTCRNASKSPRRIAQPRQSGRLQMSTRSVSMDLSGSSSASVLDRPLHALGDELGKGIDIQVDAGAVERGQVRIAIFDAHDGP